FRPTLATWLAAIAGGTVAASFTRTALGTLAARLTTLTAALSGFLPLGLLRAAIASARTRRPTEGIEHLGLGRVFGRIRCRFVAGRLGCLFRRLRGLGGGGLCLDPAFLGLFRFPFGAGFSGQNAFLFGQRRVRGLD